MDLYKNMLGGKEKTVSCACELSTGNGTGDDQERESGYAANARQMTPATRPSHLST